MCLRTWDEKTAKCHCSTVGTNIANVLSSPHEGLQLKDEPQFQPRPQANLMPKRQWSFPPFLTFREPAPIAPHVTTSAQTHVVSSDSDMAVDIPTEPTIRPEKTSRTQRSSYVEQHTVYREFTKMNDEWYTQCAAYQDKWPSDSLPVFKDLTSVREPVEQSRICHSLRFFFSGCDLCTSLDTLSSHSVSGDSHEPTALNIQPDFRCFFRGSRPHHSCPQCQKPSTCLIHLQ